MSVFIKRLVRCSLLFTLLLRCDANFGMAARRGMRLQTCHSGFGQALPVWDVRCHIRPALKRPDRSPPIFAVRNPADWGRQARFAAQTSGRKTGKNPGKNRPRFRANSLWAMSFGADSLRPLQLDQFVTERLGAHPAFCRFPGKRHVSAAECCDGSLSGLQRSPGCDHWVCPVTRGPTLMSRAEFLMASMSVLIGPHRVVRAEC